MFRFALVASALALAACAPPVPDSGAGVGFQNYDDYNSYRAARDTDLRGTSPSERTAPIPAQSAGTLAQTAASAPRAGADGPITPETLRQAGIDGQAGSSAPPSQGRVVAIPENEPTISDEQNFTAVADRQTIESDAERLRAQREAYKVVQPTALPTRSGAEGPNIVQFALNTRNGLGQQAYSRSALSGSARYQRNCAKYASPDLAQEAFLRSGGPERDRMGIDPDGDGFACAWDPTPFRKISRSNG